MSWIVGRAVGKRIVLSKTDGSNKIEWTFEEATRIMLQLQSTLEECAEWESM